MKILLFHISQKTRRDYHSNVWRKFIKKQMLLLMTWLWLFLDTKTRIAKLLGHFDCWFRIYGHFMFFSKKFQRPLSPFRFFAVPVSRKIDLLLQFSRYRHAFCGILLTTKLSTNCWKQIFEFLSQKFFTAFKNKKKKKLKKNFWLWRAVKICSNSLSTI